MTQAYSQFDALAHAYESSIDAMPFRRHVEMHSVMRVLGDLDGKAVLDMGCGSGLYAREIARAGAARVVGVDVSEGMLAHARYLEEHAPLGIRYHALDAAQPDRRAGLAGIDGPFDLVVSVYVLPYASTLHELHGLCITARRALGPASGRFVAAVLNPDFSTEPGWYDAYGMTLTMPRRDGEGAPVHLHAWFGEHTLDLDAFRWSRAAHERALADAGFRHLRWVDPELSSEGGRIASDTFWAHYLTCPHALIVEAAV